MLVEKAERQIMQVGVNFIPQITNDALPNLFEQIRIDELENTLDKKDKEKA